jgi:Protein of unknown function (DUF2934)
MADEPPGETSGPPVDAGSRKDAPARVEGEPGFNDDRIRQRAYLIWVDEGRPHGRELDHWLRAKWELGPEPDRKS